MRSGIRVRPGRQRQRACGREYHRRKKHDGGIKAEDRRGRRADDEHHPQQALRASRAYPCHRRTGGAEQALVVAQPCEHQHGGQEADDREKVADLSGRFLQ